MPLDVRTLISTVEQTLFDILNLGLRYRLAPVADITALRSADALVAADQDLRYVTAENRLYRWVLTSTAADDGLNWIQPQAAPPNGRWQRVSNPCTWGPNLNAPLHSRQAGYARSVVLYEGQGNLEEEGLLAVFGQKPAVLLQWLGDDPQAKSMRAGALYKDVLEFQILLVSQCLRPAPAAVLGSLFGAEAAWDPGLNRMIGDVRYLLAGIETGVAGIESVEIGRADIVTEDLAERLFIGSVQILVRTSFDIPDEDLVALQVQVDPEWTDFPQEGFDPLNYIASGLTIAIGPGLSRAPASGSAFIAGQVVPTAPPLFTFPANRDVYRDLKTDGSVVYLDVVPGAPAPALTPGALRLGRTRTGAAEIVADDLLCSYAASFFPPMNIP